MENVRNPPPGGARLFISYRRDDSAGYARALNDRLALAFGAERVFIDVDDIPAGAAFDATIAQALGGAAVLLVLVGPRWLAPQVNGLPRLHDPADFVHREIAAGLGGGAQVIPLLLDGAAMPSAAQLPAPLQALATRQALVLDARRFAADCDALVAQLRSVMGGPGVAPDAAPAAGRRVWLGGALAGVAALAAAGGAAWWRGGGAPSPAAAAASQPAPAPRAAVNGRWEAEVGYDWLSAPLREVLVLQGEGGSLAGTASFLRVARGIEQGVVDGSTLRFVTRSSEQLGGSERTVTHRYSGRLDGDSLRLTMQTEGAAQPHPPVDLVARRVAAP